MLCALLCTGSSLVWLGSLDDSGGVCLDSNNILNDNFF